MMADGADESADEVDLLRARTRIINNTDQEIRDILGQAADNVTQILVSQPTDYQSWHLPQVLAQINAALSRWGDQAANAAGNGQSSAWTAGSQMVDTSINDQADAASVTLNAALPIIDDTQLRAMKSFLTSKIKSVTVGTVDSINTQLGLVIMGAQTPFDAVKQVTTLLKEDTTRRATSIVQTELARAYSTASQMRMESWSDEVDGLQKQWLKSGKLHPRIAHAIIDGQIRDVDQPYDIPGGIQMMYPHDPEAPASQTINCGCCSVPVVSGWVSTFKSQTDDEKVALQKKQSSASIE